MAKTIATASSWQQALILIAADMLLDHFGGKAGDAAFDKVLKLYNSGPAQIFKNKIKGYTWHHVFPKFLNGAEDGIVALLPRRLHERFHGELYRAFSSVGLKLPGTKGATWKQVLDTKEKQSKAMEVLQEVTRRFDQQNDTNLLDALLEQMAKQLD